MKVLQCLRGSVAKICLIPFLALFLSLTVAAAAPSDKPRSLHMVAVGISEVPGQNPILSCKKDAEDMVKWAQSQKGKLFDQVHTASVIDEKGTRENILQAVKDLKARAKAGDYSILYLSSHGGFRDGKWRFAAYDQPIDWSEIQRSLRDVPGTVIVIIDACQSGGVQGENLIVFSASMRDQNTGGGNADQNSVFTRFLLEGLNGKADYDGDGVITRSELETFVSNRMKSAQQSVTVSVPANTASDLALSKTAKAAKAPQLAGTTWAGTEQLPAPYGSLSFQFQVGGKVTMIDGHDKINGTYTQSGNQVTITMPGACSYQGTIDGTTFTGRGADNTRNWSFSVNRK